MSVEIGAPISTDATMDHPKEELDTVTNNDRASMRIDRSTAIDADAAAQGGPVSRRQLLAGGAAALAAAALVRPVQANTLTPPAPALGQANMQGRFAGKVVLITGATYGIGQGTAYAFAREGASVFFCGRRQDLGQANEAEIRGFGGEATYMRADVRDDADVRAFVDGCVQKYGRIDIAFNNAGIFMTPTEVQDTDVENFLDILHTNCAGEFYAMKYEVPIMRAQGGGVIVNMASVAGSKGFPNTPAYNASKHAVVGLTKAVALANARHNIRVNALSPLAVDTPQLRESFAYQGVDPAQAADTFVTPRIMSADEMARAVMFLADDASTFVTGMNLDVTGGQLA